MSYRSIAIPDILNNLGKFNLSYKTLTILTILQVNDQQSKDFVKNMINFLLFVCTVYYI